MIQPQEVTWPEMVFGGGDKLDKLMVPMEQIPEEFRNGRNPYVELQQRWFYNGLNGCLLKEKPGVDRKKALAHLATIQGSFQPRHEHKEACVAYLMSEWFDIVRAESPD